MVVALRPDEVAEFRRRARLTQRDLAMLAGLSVRAVRDIEHGRVRRPQRRSVQRLADALGVPANDDRPAASAAHPARDVSLRVGVLGPLTVRRGETRIDIGSVKVRSLLGLLAVQPGHLVTRDEIVDALWGGRPPRTSGDQLHSHVARLRRLLDDLQRGDATLAVVSTGGGYRLDGPPDAVDVLCFARLTNQAEAAQVAGDRRAAADLLARALEQWRGPVLAGLDRLSNHPAATAVSQRRLAAAMAWADLAIELGQAEDVIEQLATLAHDEPLHEGLQARLMLAMAGAGQRAAALRLFADTRDRLVDELGIEPGAEMQVAHLRILREQPSAATLAGGGAGVPQQLPLDLHGFTGRDRELAGLDAMLTRTGTPATVVIASVCGMAGVGKTALAVHWAHRVRDRFRDGTLFVNLRGYDPVGVPVRPDEALDGFLHALGVPPERIPRTVEERAALFRSQLHHRRMLVLLDNAATSEQVRWLLPGSAGCLVVVTSRGTLSGLTARYDACRLSVDLLPPRDARALLRRVIGGRVDDEPTAAAELARLCGRLPLALRLAAERAGTHRTLTLAELTHELRDEYDRLDLLAAADDEETTLRAVFSWSYAALAPAAARMFRLLGLHPGPEISLPAAAALCATEKRQTRRLLETLAGVHLLQESAPDRYRFHDLLRMYARDRAHADEPPVERDDAVRRVLDWYLHTADSADRLLMPRRRRVPLDPPSTVTQPVPFASAGAALGWCEKERANLVAATRCAAVNQLSDIAWKLPLLLWSYFTVRKRWTDWIATHELGLAATRASHDRHGEAHLLTGLAHAHRDVRDFDTAFTHFERAVSLAREIGDPWVEAAAQNLLGIAWRDVRRFEDALSCCRAALAIFEELDDPWGKAWSLYNLGEICADLRRHGDAITYTRQALALFTAIDDPWGTGWSLSILAHTHRRLHRFDQATEYCHRALAASRHIGNRQGEALALYNLGKIQHDTGRTDRARESWHQALSIFEELGAPQATEVRARLAADEAPTDRANSDDDTMPT
jgi:DNA-binding SARP family transcriptional activator/tetratricopeptide (TPR) repeat protein/DNA-binding XRE family transcriptional regulator